MATIDLTLNAIKIPALEGYTPPFGVKKVSGGLTTQEVNDNVIAPFVKERPIEITEDSSTGSVEYNASLVINQAGATLTLGSGSFIGCVVKIIAATAGSVSYNSGTTDELAAGQIVNYIWGGSAWISDIALVHKSIASADNALNIDKKDVHATYSTTEQLTGDYWTDGKPIYRITYQGTTTTYSDANSQREFTLPTTSGVSSYVNCYGSFKPNNGSLSGTTFGYPQTVVTSAMNLIVLAPNIRLASNTLITNIITYVTHACTSIDYTMTVFYTKTTV